MKKLLYLPLAFLLLTFGTSHLFAQKDKETKTKKTRKVKIVTQKDNEPKKVMEWDGQGEMPKEMKEYLEKENFKIGSMNFKSGKGNKIHIKGNKKGKNGEKGETFEYDMDMPNIAIPELENLKFDMDKMGNDIKMYKFDEGKFKKDMEGFKFDMKNFDLNMKDFELNMEQFGKDMDNMKFDNMHINIGDIENGFVFKMDCDSMKKNRECRTIIINGRRDSLRSMGRNLRALRRMERLSDLKEGTTEETKEIDLGNGKTAKITTKRIVVISEKPKTDIKAEDISSSIKIFPNPNQGIFTLEFVAQNQGDARITITSVQGKQVYQEDVKGLKGTYKKEIKLADDSSPNYILRIEQGGKSYTKQIMVNR